MAESSNFETSRKVAEITLTRIKNWEDLNAKTITGGNFRFNEKSRELWKEFAVHGLFGKDTKGEKTIVNFTDLDGKVAIGLLREAGMDTSDLKYIEPGEFLPGGINIDTGGRNGIVLEDNGQTVFFDHHTDSAGQDTSATKLVYEGLTSVGLLDKTEYLDKLVEFVTQVDNGKAEGPFEDSYRTLVGLYRFLPFPKLLAFFKAGRSANEILTGSDLGWLDVKKKSETVKKNIEEDNKKFEELEKNGFVFDTENYGRVVIDIDKNLASGANITKSKGCETYVIWNPKEDSFFISSSHTLDFDLPQGKRVREKMWIKPRHDKGPLEVGLGDIIEKLAGKDFVASGGLKEYLDSK